jgi:hypothetical protein
MKTWLMALSFIVTLGFGGTVAAQVGQTKEITTSQTFGDYRVHFTVFNSTSIPADVAKIYNIVRGSDRALVNISLVKVSEQGASLGLKADVSGNTRNLMQQSQALKFMTIDEGDAVYYLAPFVFNNEELLYFTVDVAHPELTKPLRVTFNRTLYKD